MQIVIYILKKLAIDSGPIMNLYTARRKRKNNLYKKKNIKKSSLKITKKKPKRKQHSI